MVSNSGIRRDRRALEAAGKSAQHVGQAVRVTILNLEHLALEISLSDVVVRWCRFVVLLARLLRQRRRNERKYQGKRCQVLHSFSHKRKTS